MLVKLPVKSPGAGVFERDTAESQRLGCVLPNFTRFPAIVAVLAATFGLITAQTH